MSLKSINSTLLQFRLHYSFDLNWSNALSVNWFIFLIQNFSFIGLTPDQKASLSDLLYLLFLPLLHLLRYLHFNLDWHLQAYSDAATAKPFSTMDWQLFILLLQHLYGKSGSGKTGSGNTESSKAESGKTGNFEKVWKFRSKLDMNLAII